MFTAATSNYAYFAGGWVWYGLPSGSQVFSTNVDVYNAAANTWAVTHLPQLRYQSATLSVNGYIAFVGGQMWKSGGWQNTKVADVLYVSGSFGAEAMTDESSSASSMYASLSIIALIIVASL